MLSPNITSNLADEFLGLCPAELQQELDTDQCNYTQPIFAQANTVPNKHKIELPNDVKPLFKVEEDSELANAFLQRKAALAKKYGESKVVEKVEKPQKTKEELAAIRKAMLKPKTIVEAPKVVEMPKPEIK